MAKYEVHVFCSECSRERSARITLTLNDGPPKKESIGDAYQGRDLPATIVMVRKNSHQCPETGMTFAQDSNNDIFLVPIG
jgi:hypothetical protein